MATLTFRKEYNSLYDYTKDLAKQSGVYIDRLANDVDTGLAYINTLAQLQAEKTSSESTDVQKQTAADKLTAIGNLDTHWLNGSDAYTLVQLTTGAITEDEFKSYFKSEDGKQTFDDYYNSIDDYFNYQRQREHDKWVFDNMSNTAKFFNGVGYVISEFVTAPIKMVEGIVDGVAYVISGFGAVEEIANWVAEDTFGVTTTLTDFRRKYVDFEDQGGGWAVAGSIASELGKLAVTMALGGSNLTFQLPLIGKMTLGQMLYQGSMIGQTAEDTLRRYGPDASWGQQFADFAGTMAIEWLTELIFKGDPRMPKGAIGLKQAVGANAKYIAIRAGQEAIEEGIAEIFQPMYQSYIETGEFKPDGSWLKDIALSAMIGGIIGGAGATINLATINSNKVGFLADGVKMSKAEIATASEIVASQGNDLQKANTSNTSEWYDSNNITDNVRSQFEEKVKTWDGKSNIEITTTESDGSTTTKNISPKQIKKYNKAVETDNKNIEKAQAAVYALTDLREKVGDEKFNDAIIKYDKETKNWKDVATSWLNFIASDPKTSIYTQDIRNVVGTYNTAQSLMNRSTSDTTTEQQTSQQQTTTTEQQTTTTEQQSTETTEQQTETTTQSEESKPTNEVIGRHLISPVEESKLTNRHYKFMQVMSRIFKKASSKIKSLKVIFVDRVTEYEDGTLVKEHASVKENKQVELYRDKEGNGYLFVDNTHFNKKTIQQTLSTVAKLDILLTTDSRSGVKLVETVDKIRGTEDAKAWRDEFVNILSALLDDPALATKLFITDKHASRTLIKNIKQKRDDKNTSDVFKRIYNNMLWTLRQNIIRGFPKKAKLLVAKQLSDMPITADTGKLIFSSTMEGLLTDFSNTIDRIKNGEDIEVVIKELKDSIKVVENSTELSEDEKKLNDQKKEFVKELETVIEEHKANMKAMQISETVGQISRTNLMKLDDRLSTVVGRLTRGEITHAQAKQELLAYKTTKQQYNDINNSLTENQNKNKQILDKLTSLLDKYSNAVEDQATKYKTAIEVINERLLKSIVSEETLDYQEETENKLKDLANENGAENLPFFWALVTNDIAPHIVQAEAVKASVIKAGFNPNINAETVADLDLLVPMNYTQEFLASLAIGPDKPFSQALSEWMFANHGHIILNDGHIVKPVNLLEKNDDGTFKYIKFNELLNAFTTKKVLDLNDTKDEVQNVWKTITEDTEDYKIKLSEYLTDAFFKDFESLVDIDKATIVLFSKKDSTLNGRTESAKNTIYINVASNKITEAVCHEFSHLLAHWADLRAVVHKTLMRVLKNVQSVDIINIYNALYDAGLVQDTTPDMYFSIVQKTLYKYNFNEKLVMKYDSKKGNDFKDYIPFYTDGELVITSTGIYGTGKLSGFKVVFTQQLQSELRKTYSTLLTKADLLQHRSQAVVEKAKQQKPTNATKIEKPVETTSVVKSDKKATDVTIKSENNAVNTKESKLMYTSYTNKKNALLFYDYNKASSEQKDIYKKLKEALGFKDSSKKIPVSDVAEALYNSSEFSPEFKQLFFAFAAASTGESKISVTKSNLKEYASAKFSTVESSADISSTELKFLLDTCYNCKTLKIETGDDLRWWIDTGFATIVAIANNEKYSKDLENIKTIKDLKQYVESKYKESVKSVSEINKLLAEDKLYSELLTKYNSLAAKDSLTKSEQEELTNLESDLLKQYNKIVNNNSEFLYDSTIVDAVTAIQANTSRNAYTPILGSTASEITLTKTSIVNHANSIKATASWASSIMAKLQKTTKDGETLDVLTNIASNDKDLSEQIEDKSNQSLGHIGYKQFDNALSDIYDTDSYQNILYVQIENAVDNDVISSQLEKFWHFVEKMYTQRPVGGLKLFKNNTEALIKELIGLTAEDFKTAEGNRKNNKINDFVKKMVERSSILNDKGLTKKLDKMVSWNNALADMVEKAIHNKSIRNSEKRLVNKNAQKQLVNKAKQSTKHLEIAQTATAVAQDPQTFENSGMSQESIKTAEDIASGKKVVETKTETEQKTEQPTEASPVSTLLTEAEQIKTINQTTSNDQKESKEAIDKLAEEIINKLPIATSLTVNTYEGNIELAKMVAEKAPVYHIESDSVVVRQLLKEIESIYDTTKDLTVIFKLIEAIYKRLDNMSFKRNDRTSNELIRDELFLDMFSAWHGRIAGIVMVAGENTDLYKTAYNLAVRFTQMMSSKAIALRRGLDIFQDQFLKLNEKTISDLTLALEKVGAETDKLIKKLRDTISDLIKQYGEKEVELEKANKTHKELVDKKQKLQKQIEDYNKKLDDLKNTASDEAAKTQEKLNETQKELNKLNSDLKALDSKIKKLTEETNNESAQTKKLDQILSLLKSSKRDDQIKGLLMLEAQKDQLPKELEKDETLSALKQLTKESYEKYGKELGLWSNWSILFDRARRFRYLAMLSSPSTWQRNFNVNMIMKGMEALTEMLQSSDIVEKIATHKLDFERLEESGVQSTITYRDDDGEQHSYKFPVVQFDWKRVNLPNHVYEWISTEIFPQEELDKKFGKGGKYGEFKKHKEESITDMGPPKNWFDRLMDFAGTPIEWILTVSDSKFTHPMVKRVFGQLILSNINQLTKAILTKQAASLGLDVKSSKFSENPDVKRVLELKTIIESNPNASINEFKEFVDLIPKEFISRLQETAIAYTKKTFFKNDNKLGEMMRKLSESHPWLALPLDTLSPFIRMSANVAMTVYEYSPVGFFSWLNKKSTYNKMLSKVEALMTIANKELAPQIEAQTKELAKLYNSMIKDGNVDISTVEEAVTRDLEDYEAKTKNKETPRLTDEQAKQLKEQLVSLKAAIARRADILNNQVNNIANGQTGFEKVDIIRSFSKASLGTGLLIVGVILKAIGLLNIDKDEDYMGVVLDIAGWKIRLSDFSPASSSIILGVALYDSIASLINPNYRGSETAFDTLLTTILNDTPLDFIADAIEYSDNVAEWFANIVSGLLVQYVPNILKQTNKIWSQNKKVKSSDSWKRILENVEDQSSILRDLVLEDKIDPYTGETVKRGDNGGMGLAIMEMLYLVTGVKTVYRNTSSVESEVRKLGVTSSGATGRFSIKGKEYKLSGSDLTEFKKYRGEYIKTKLNKLLSSKVYIKASDDKKKELIKQVYTMASDYAKTMWYRKSRKK